MHTHYTVLYAHTPQTKGFSLQRDTWGAVAFPTEDTLSWQRAEANGLLINLDQMTLRQNNGRLLNPLRHTGQMQRWLDRRPWDLTTMWTRSFSLHGAAKPVCNALHFHTHRETCSIMLAGSWGDFIFMRRERDVPVESIFICCVWEQPWDSTLFCSITHLDVSTCSSLPSRRTFPTTSGKGTIFILNYSPAN